MIKLVTYKKLMLFWRQALIICLFLASFQWWSSYPVILHGKDLGPSSSWATTSLSAEVVQSTNNNQSRQWSYTFWRVSHFRERVGVGNRFRVIFSLWSVSFRRMYSCQCQQREWKYLSQVANKGRIMDMLTKTDWSCHRTVPSGDSNFPL